MTASGPRGATLPELAREVPGATLHGDPSVTVRDVRHDSRAVEPGDLFVVRRGRHADGMDYVSDALARGAVALAMGPSSVEATVPSVNVPVIVVPDPEAALARMSSFVWAHPTWTLDVIGITGTNGKTTTAWLVEHALQATGARPGLLGTVAHRFGTRIWPALHTTPEADDLARRFAAMRDDGATHAVMEVSSIALSLQRVAAVRFRVAAFTNVTQDHLDFHGTMDGYIAAKRSLFLAHGPGASVLNADDPVGRDIARAVPHAITYSAHGDHATLAVTRGGATAHGIDALVHSPEGDITLRSGLAGAHNVENLLCALGILGALGIPYAVGARALESAPAAPGRLEPVVTSVPVPFTVLVDYAHTPDALARVLSTLRASTSGKVVCVFGCGGDRDPAKRAAMGRAVGLGADVAVLTTDNPRTEDPAVIARAAAEGLREGGMTECAHGVAPASRTYSIEPDRRTAITEAVSLARAGDVVLVAGKGHETYQEVHGVRLPFDDREEARRALAARAALDAGGR